MNLELPTVVHPYRKSCKPQEEYSGEIKGKDNFYIVNKLFLFFNLCDDHYNILVKYSCN